MPRTRAQAREDQDQQSDEADSNTQGGMQADPLATLIQGLLQQQQQMNQTQIAQLLQGFQLLVERIQPPAQGPKVGGVKDFKSLNPPEFHGNGSPIEAEEWCATVENLLAAASIPEEEKVNVVRIQLHGPAKAWMDNLFISLGGVISWDRFKQEFYAQYFPSDSKALMVERFLQLQQGSLSVDSYAYEFDQLSRYARAIVPTEEDKVRRFVQGLKVELRKYLLSRLPESTREAHLAARRLEQADASRTAALPSSFTHSATPKRDASKISGTRSVNRPTKTTNTARETQTQGSVASKPTCSFCGIKGHTHDNCWRAAGKCLGCGADDHRVSECPVRKAKGFNKDGSLPSESKGQSSEATPSQDSLFQVRHQRKRRGKGKMFTLTAEAAASDPEIVTEPDLSLDEDLPDFHQQ